MDQEKLDRFEELRAMTGLTEEEQQELHQLAEELALSAQSFGYTCIDHYVKAQNEE